MDGLDKKDLNRFLLADYRIIAKNPSGKVVGKSGADKGFTDSPRKFEHVSESTIYFDGVSKVNRVVLQMREEGKKGWVDISFRIIPIMNMTSSQHLFITWTLTLEWRKRIEVTWG